MRRGGSAGETERFYLLIPGDRRTRHACLPIAYICLYFPIGFRKKVGDRRRKAEGREAGVGNRIEAVADADGATDQ